MLHNAIEIMLQNIWSERRCDGRRVVANLSDVLTVEMWSYGATVLDV
jgi:hypothetical protein